MVTRLATVSREAPPRRREHGCNPWHAVPHADITPHGQLRGNGPAKIADDDSQVRRCEVADMESSGRPRRQRRAPASASDFVDPDLVDSLNQRRLSHQRSRGVVRREDAERRRGEQARGSYRYLRPACCMLQRRMSTVPFRFAYVLMHVSMVVCICLHY